MEQDKGRLYDLGRKVSWALDSIEICRLREASRNVTKEILLME